MAYNLRQIKTIIYRLKRSYGQPLLIQYPITNVVNLTTGDMTRVYTTVSVKRAVVLPAKIAKDFVYDLSFIAANKNFTMGGYFDKDARVVILENKDFVTEISLRDHIEFEQQRFEIKTIDRSLYATMLLVQAVDGGRTVGRLMEADSDININQNVQHIAERSTGWNSNAITTSEVAQAASAVVIRPNSETGAT